MSALVVLWLAGKAEEMVKLETMVKTKREGERANRVRAKVGSAKSEERSWKSEVGSAVFESVL